MGTPSCCCFFFFANFTKGHNFCDFLFAFLADMALRNWDILLKERTCCKRSKFFPLRVNPSWEGKQICKWQCYFPWKVLFHGKRLSRYEWKHKCEFFQSSQWAVYECKIGGGHAWGGLRENWRDVTTDERGFWEWSHVSWTLTLPPSVPTRPQKVQLKLTSNYSALDPRHNDTVCYQRFGCKKNLILTLNRICCYKETWYRRLKHEYWILLNSFIMNHTFCIVESLGEPIHTNIKNVCFPKEKDMTVSENIHNLLIFV